ncbi:hypothetical protein ACE2AJ_08455 [Aquihabitans daechungensis]|uniref:hypothetical protein n=1 Tax=Aquihabitans daechungensis TaxID=1052257 RepID=UPI003B9E517F
MGSSRTSASCSDWSVATAARISVPRLREKLPEQWGRPADLAAREVLDEQVGDGTDVGDPAVEAHGVVEAGLVEAAGEGRPPVDDELVAVLIDPVEADAPRLVVVDAAEDDQLLLQLLHGAPHHGVDVLVREGVGTPTGDPGERRQLRLDRGAGACERRSFAVEVDGGARSVASHCVRVPAAVPTGPTTLPRTAVRGKGLVA